MDFTLNKIFTLLENHFSHDQNITTLKRKLEELNAVKEDNESKRSVELQPRKKLKKQVDIWFRHVETINGEILNDLEKVERSNRLFRGFLGSNVLKRIPEVEELIQRGKSYDDLVIDDPQWIGQVLSTTNLSGKVAENIMKEIWTYLMDDDVSKIGVWGMGGVGKTTIMKLINNQLLKETEKFKPVMWITVSKELNIAKLQDDIVRAMKESPLEDDDVTRRAGMMYEKLSQKGKYVLILDDVWASLSLEEVGIPEPSNGSKLVVTTRMSELCDYLDCLKVKVPTLPKDDASRLFSRKVGRDVLNDPVLSPTVEAVIEQCAGLPLAIVTVASTMKGKCDIHEWRNALIELERRAQSVNNFDEKVLQQLKFSYDLLENERVKQCFLYCALWPEDHRIDADELIGSWIDEGLVEELGSMQEEFDRGHTILNKLINNCLLENGVFLGRSYVKLHDLVRDLALDITTKGKPRFLVRAGMQLKEIPDLKEWAEDLDKVSLMRNSEMEIPPEMSPPKCPSLTTLLLASCYIRCIPERFFEQMHGLKILDLSRNNIESLPNSISDLENLTKLLLASCKIRSIPERFFEQMHGLKILDLSRNLIESLPNSISDLENLTALSLRRCYCLKNMPSFSKLLALEKLNLEETGIKNLPDGMERLVKLKYLNFSDTDITKIPDGILSKFSCLQHLEGGGQVLRGDEIGGLRKLEIFKGRFRDVEELSNYAQALNGQTQGPREYLIVVGDGFTPDDFVAFEKCIGLLNCQIYRNGAKFPSDVRELIIRRCSFEFGEELLFSRLIPVPHPTFSALTVIEINRCPKLKKLFSSDWVPKNLQNLKQLSVEDCKAMEEIIATSASEGMDSNNTLNLAVPKLSSLKLWGLPELKSIYSAKGAMVCDSLQNVTIDGCPKLKKLFSSDWVPKILQNLEVLRVSNCDEMEEIIASSASEGMDSSNTLNLALTKLRSLYLEDLPELKSIYSAKGAIVCDSLQIGQIKRCPKLKKLFSSVWVPKNLQNLEVLEVEECDEMEEIIASSASEGMDSSNTLNLALPKLSSLKLWGLPELKSIYSAKGAMVCDSLQSVSIDRCPKLKRIPLYLPLLEEGRPSPPPSLSSIWMDSEESWENMEWDHPYAKSLLEPFVNFIASLEDFLTTIMNSDKSLKNLL